MSLIKISSELKSIPKNPGGIQFECHKWDKTSLSFWARGPENVTVTYQIVGDGVAARFYENEAMIKTITRTAKLKRIFPTKVEHEVSIGSDDCTKIEETFDILAAIEEVGNPANRNNTACICSYTIISPTSNSPESAANE